MAGKMASKEATFCILVLLIVTMAVVVARSLQRLRMTIEMACDGGTFAHCLRYFV